MTQPVFEFYSANEFREYPFDARRDDGLHELFVDAYVMHTAHRDNTGRLRMVSFNPAGDLELRFEDGTLLGNLTSADGFISSSFGRFTLYEWRKSVTYGAGFTSEDLIARLVTITEKLSDFSFPVSPSHAYLLASRVNPRPLNVVSTALAFPGLACCLGGPNRNALQMESGYNLELSTQAPESEVGLALAETPEVRAPEEVSVSALAGAGAGTFPLCEDPSEYVRSLNGVQPNDEKDFRLGMVDCTWEETRLVGATSPPVNPNTDYLGSIIDATEKVILQMHQACRACCDCPDYGRAYDIIYTTWSRAKNVNNRLIEVLGDYERILNEYKELKAERENDLQVKLRLIATPDYQVAIAVQLGNNSHTDLNPMTLTIGASVSGLSVAYIEGSGFIEAEGTHNSQRDPGGTPGGPFTVEMPALAPGKYAVFRMAVRYTGTARAGKYAEVSARVVNDTFDELAEHRIKIRGPLVKE